jgi:hypothetical protein
MENNEVKIEEIILRFPKEFKKVHHRIGKEIMTKITNNLSIAIQYKRLDSIAIRVEIQGKKSHDEISRLIAEAIIKGLQ